MNAPILDYATLNDSQLVGRHLAGDRGAFPEIVARYQSMVCALTLSACGDIGRSEDLAQEVFVTAWKKLPELREPEKLRGWFCGIARHLTQNSWRRLERTPTARAEELSAELAGGDIDPREQASGVEERALLWRLLETIPANYREPLVLYYREERSVSAVAAALEISEEAVRQRLARGRALLNERMATIVEETLLRTAPTAAFGAAVLVLLPLGLGPTTEAAAAGVVGKGAIVAGTVGSAAAKGGLGVKLLGAAAVLPVLLNALTGFLGFRSSYDAVKTSEHRRLVTRAHLGLNLGIGAGIVLVAVCSTLTPEWMRRHVWAYGVGMVLLPCLSCVAGVLWGNWPVIRARARGEAITPERQLKALLDGPGFEYRSQRSFLGLPLVHIQVGAVQTKPWKPVKAWIAVGGVACGGLFAGGGFAIAPISVGGITLGLLSSGGLALGGFAVGGTAVGALAAGGVAVGLFARGGLAVAAFTNEHFRAVADVMLFTAIAAWSLSWLPPLLLIGWHRTRNRATR